MVTKDYCDGLYMYTTTDSFPSICLGTLPHFSSARG